MNYLLKLCMMKDLNTYFCISSLTDILLVNSTQQNILDNTTAANYLRDKEKCIFAFSDKGVACFQVFRKSDILASMQCLIISRFYATMFLKKSCILG